MNNSKIITVVLIAFLLIGFLVRSVHEIGQFNLLVVEDKNTVQVYDKEGIYFLPFKTVAKWRHDFGVVFSDEVRTEKSRKGIVVTKEDNSIKIVLNDERKINVSVHAEIYFKDWSALEYYLNNCSGGNYSKEYFVETYLPGLFTELVHEAFDNSQNNELAPSNLARYVKDSFEKRFSTSGIILMHLMVETRIPES